MGFGFTWQTEIGGRTLDCEAQAECLDDGVRPNGSYALVDIEWADEDGASVELTEIEEAAVRLAGETALAAAIDEDKAARLGGVAA